MRGRQTTHRAHRARRKSRTKSRKTRATTSIAILAAVGLVAVIAYGGWRMSRPVADVAATESAPHSLAASLSSSAPGPDFTRVRPWRRRHRHHPQPADSGRPTVTPSAAPSSAPVPVPAPSPGQSGSQTTGCAGDPHVCGYPDSSNTGVPAGVQLRQVPGQVTSGPGWHWDPRGWISITKPGTVVSGISVDATVSVEAPDVTIKDSYINCTGGCDFNVIIRTTATGAEADANNTVIEDSTVTDTSATSPVGIEAETVSNTQVLRDNISAEGTGVLFAGGGGVVEDSYIHDLATCCGFHNEDFQSTAGGNATLSHNTLFNSASQTADIIIAQDFGGQSNVTIDNNLLAGGGWSVYGGDTGNNESSPATDIRITNNRLSDMFYKNCGYYGWLAAFNTPAASGNVASGNYWDATGKPASE
jgi:hypothetical protein